MSNQFSSPDGAPLATAEGGTCLLCGETITDAYEHAVAFHAQGEGKEGVWRSRQGTRKITLPGLISALQGIKGTKLTAKEKLEAFDEVILDMYAYRTRMEKEAIPSDPTT